MRSSFLPKCQPNISQISGLEVGQKSEFSGPLASSALKKPSWDFNFIVIFETIVK
jgi:hypothetical protein